MSYANGTGKAMALGRVTRAVKIGRQNKADPIGVTGPLHSALSRLTSRDAVCLSRTEETSSAEPADPTAKPRGADRPAHDDERHDQHNQQLSNADIEHRLISISTEALSQPIEQSAYAGTNSIPCYLIS